jgi:ElaB/YqjD/DUF883 family membrane-anchored ribosome-binding protein
MQQATSPEGQEFGDAPGVDATTTAKVAEAAHRAVDIAAANLAEAEEALREARRAAGITATETAQKAQAMSEESLESLRAYVQANPLKAVGIAVAAGYLTAALLKK